MDYPNKATRFLIILLSALAVLGSHAAQAQHAKKIEVPEQMQALADEQCPTGTAEAYLDINNVRARIFNNGALFWRGDPSVYEVPKGSGNNAMFTVSLWVAGTVQGELRAVSTNYGGYEFWPGPLDAAGNPPTDCDAFDRIYNVSVRDFLLYEQLGLLTPDLQDWPWRLGAPVRDGDGISGNYNFEGGDRPDLLGHQTLWWIMNDLGGDHRESKTPPLGLEVQGTAFAVASGEPALDNTTFYRYRISYRGEAPLEDAYVAFFADVDLGYFYDDYTGSDTTLGMGFVYNADNDDDTKEGYGEAPPAVGIDLLQGPLIAPDGQDNDRDGLIDEAGERLMMTAYIANNEVHKGYGGDVLYNHIRGRWFRGEPIIDGCVYPDPRYCLASSSGDTTGFMVPGDPVTRQFWSDMNFWQGQPYEPYDHKMLVSAGPFTMQPGDEQEVVFAIVWARGSDFLDSITRLREADRVVQAAWDAGFDIALPDRAPPAEAPMLVAPADGAAGQPINLSLRWQAADGADAYLLEFARDPAFVTGSTTVVSSAPFFTDDRREIAGNTSLTLDTLSQNATYYWRLRGLNTAGLGPASRIHQFSTSDITLRHGEVLRLSDGSAAFVEIVGPGGSDPCDPQADHTFGCEEVGGNLVYDAINSTGDYMLSSNRQVERWIGYYAPHNYEIRFTAEGSYAIHWGGRTVSWVPFEIWDIGPVDPFTENDPGDDVQFVPALSAPFTQGGECLFAYDDDPFIPDRLGLGWPGTDFIDAFYPATTYADWEAVAKPVIDNDPDRCAVIENGWEYTAFPRRIPLLLLRFYGNPNGPGYRHEGPPEGTVVRFYTTAHGVTSPVPSGPIDGSALTSLPVTLWWNAARDTWGRPLENHVQLSSTPDFRAIVDEDSLHQEHYTAVNLLPGETYYWRIRSRERRGLFSAWSDVWHFKAGQATAVEAPEVEVPTTYVLHQNYPNPFNPTTTIRFGVPRPGRVRLVIYNVLGQKVETLMEGALPPGWHVVHWDASSLASGVYFYRLEADGSQEVKRMLLVK